MKSSIDPSSGHVAFRRCRRWLDLAGVILLALAADGCSLIHTGTRQSQALIRSVLGTRTSDDTAERLALIQLIVMREADRHVAVIAQATDDFAAKVGTPEARFAAKQWKLQQATAVYVSATGENPILNAVDMVILATVSRMVMEDHWVGEAFGAAAQPLLEVHRQLETNAWAGLDCVLTRGYREELAGMIAAWREANPRQRHVAAARFSDFVKRIRIQAPAAPAAGSASLLDLAMVNPLSGLDPAVRAIEQSRQLAVRVTYYAERAALLLSWHAELLTFRLADQPETRQMLTNVNRVAGSAQSFAKTAGELPGLVREEREAAINQLLAGVANERSNILATLNAQEAQLKELLPQVRQTLAAGTDMAGSVKGAVQSLDALVRLVSPPETNATPASTNSRPFDILDYGAAATQIGAMATNLTALIQSVNQSEAQVARLGRQVNADAREVITHAFRLAVVLVLLIGLILALAIWIYRRPRPAGRGGASTA